MRCLRMSAVMTPSLTLVSKSAASSEGSVLPVMGTVTLTSGWVKENILMQSLHVPQ